VDLLARLEDESLQHLEIQGRNDRRMARRMVVYHALLAERYGDEFRSAVLYFGEAPMRMPTVLKTRQLGFWYDCVDIRSFDVEELLESGRAGDCVLAFLAGNKYRRVLKRVREFAAPERERAMALLAVLSNLRTLPRSVRLEVEKMGQLYDVRKNTLLMRWRQEAIDEGRAEGGAQILETQLAAKFGTVPEWATERVRKATAAQLTRWGRKILTAEWQDSELAAIAAMLADLKRDTPKQAAHAIRRVSRDWAIETGNVEDLYYLKRGVTETLLTDGIRPDRIPQGLSADALQLIEDQEGVVDWLFEYVKGEYTFSRTLIREIHAMLVRHQPFYQAHTAVGVVDKPLLGGELKTDPNSVMTTDGERHEYCPVEHTSAELDRLVALYLQYEESRVAPEIVAAWLHHRFTQIHPFPDGNGRVARALASLTLIRAGAFPLLVRRDDGPRYWAVLQGADQGKFRPFLEFVRMTQRREAVRVGFVKPGVPTRGGSVESIDDILSAIESKLVEREELIPHQWLQTVTVVEGLANTALNSMTGLGSQIQQRLGHRQGFDLKLSDSSPAGFKQLTSAEPMWRKDEFDRVCRAKALIVTLGAEYQFAVTFCGTSKPFSGIAAAEFLLIRGGDEVLLYDPSAAFVIYYTESQEQAHPRFTRWIETQFAEGLKTLKEHI
jgi:fido (protein-threonine AMPylation protein)